MSEEAPHLEITAGVHRGQSLIIPESGARIGRAPENDIKLDDAALSRFQCRLFFRDGGLWVADLGSTNETLVNGRTVQESMLRSNDVITIGETSIQVVRSRLGFEEEEPATGVIVSRPVSEHELDLGLDTPPLDETSDKPRRKHVPGFLWVIAAAAVLVALLTVLPKLLKDMGATPIAPVGPVEGAPADRSLAFSYEKVLASEDNIYRFALRLDANELDMKMHDLRDSRQAVKTRTISEDIERDLRSKLAATRFFDARENYASRSDSGYELVDLEVSIGPDTHRSRALNQPVLAPELAGAIQIIDAFAEVEFGLKALSQPPEKLKELAQSAFQAGLKKWSERSASFSNLWKAIVDLRQVDYFLETIEDKPDYYRDAKDLLQEAELALEKQYSDLNFKVEQAQRTAQWEAAADHLRTICLLIPDRTDSRHQEAQSKLNVVTQRIPR